MSLDEKVEMKKGILIIASVLIAFAFASESSAQTKKRIGLAEGADSVEVTGSISGNRYAMYEIWVDKGNKWDVVLDSSNEFIGYTVKDPDGDRYDFLTEPAIAGYYTIRVELNSKGSKSKRPASFILRIKFEMGPGGPIGD